MAVQVEQLITEHLDLWTQAKTAKSTSGRGSNNKIELTGIKKLRELILELAVRGKLVPQDANDEPAYELLKRIAAEKEELVKAGKLKNPKTISSIDDKEFPFSIQPGWRYARFGDLVINRDNERIPLSVDERANRKGSFDYYGASGVIDSINDYLFDKPLLLIGEDGANLINRSTPIAFIARGKYWVNNHAHVIDGISEEFLNYICLFINAISLESYVTGTAQPKMNQAKMNSIVVALPPIAEQSRILKKVDELMALCDQLEQQSYQQLYAHNQLVDALLATLTQSLNADELASNWQRLAAHFDTLFTTEYSINALKQTILQLAVMGKLVKQDSNDEPASELLKRIAAEKDVLVKAGKIKKQKPLPPISDDEKPFELSEGWEWCRLPDLGELSRGKSKHRPRNDPRLFKDGTYPLVQTGDVARSDKLIMSYASTYNDFGLAQSRLWPKGTLCITIAANIADTGVLGIEACFPDSVVGYLPYSSNIPVEYFDYFIKVTKDDLERFAPSTAQKNINLEILGDLLVPCPPENEIKRIFYKVEELLALCNNFAQKISLSKRTQAVIAETLVDQVVN